MRHRILHFSPVPFVCLAVSKLDCLVLSYWHFHVRPFEVPFLDYIASDDRHPFWVRSSLTPMSECHARRMDLRMSDIQSNKYQGSVEARRINRECMDTDALFKSKIVRWFVDSIEVRDWMRARCANWHDDFKVQVGGQLQLDSDRG